MGWRLPESAGVGLGLFEDDCEAISDVRALSGAEDNQSSDVPNSEMHGSEVSSRQGSLHDVSSCGGLPL